LLARFERLGFDWWKLFDGVKNTNRNSPLITMHALLLLDRRQRIRIKIFGLDLLLWISPSKAVISEQCQRHGKIQRRKSDDRSSISVLKMCIYRSSSLGFTSVCVCVYVYR
jgi:hypothetical protein